MRGLLRGPQSAWGVARVVGNDRKLVAARWTSLRLRCRSMICSRQYGRQSAEREKTSIVPFEPDSDASDCAVPVLYRYLAVISPQRLARSYERFWETSLRTKETT